MLTWRKFTIKWRKTNTTLGTIPKSNIKIVERQSRYHLHICLYCLKVYYLCEWPLETGRKKGYLHAFLACFGANTNTFDCYRQYYVYLVFPEISRNLSEARTFCWDWWNCWPSLFKPSSFHNALLVSFISSSLGGIIRESNWVWIIDWQNIIKYDYEIKCFTCCHLFVPSKFDKYVIIFLATLFYEKLWTQSVLPNLFSLTL